MKPRFTLSLSGASQLQRAYTLLNFITTGNCDDCEELFSELVGIDMKDTKTEDFQFYIQESSRIFDWFEIDNSSCEKEIISETISRVEQQLAGKEFDTYDDEESWQEEYEEFMKDLDVQILQSCMKDWV